MLLIAQMTGQLRLQTGLQHPLHQLRQEPALPGQLHPALIDPVHQLIQEPWSRSRSTASCAGLFGPSVFAILSILCLASYEAFTQTT